MSDTPRTDEYISPDAIGAIPSLCRQLERELAAKAEECEAKQAQIDALMLEYCPDEMTPGQLAEWEKHQRAAREGK